MSHPRLFYQLKSMTQPQSWTCPCADNSSSTSLACDVEHPLMAANDLRVVAMCRGGAGCGADGPPQNRTGMLPCRPPCITTVATGTVGMESVSPGDIPSPGHLQRQTLFLVEGRSLPRTAAEGERESNCLRLCGEARTKVTSPRADVRSSRGDMPCG